MSLWLIAYWFVLFISEQMSGAQPNLGEKLKYNASRLLDKLLDNYDRRLRPGFGGPPTMVDVNLNIRSMGPITEKDMTYKMDCYFRQSWVDRRLAFSGSLQTLTVSINLLDRMWKPDTHFFNGRASYLHTVTTPNKLLRINQDGRILYSMRLTIQASCPMHLEKFPMDTQTCPLQFGSHGYGIDDVVYKWTHGTGNSIKMAPDMRLSQFDLIAFPAWTRNKTLIDDMYSLLQIKFILRRHTGYFLINVYVPCCLLTVLSWVGFWINREATADRIALGVTVVLTMAFMSIENRSDLPKVSYSTALDYYVGICFAFVLATIIQFAAVHFFTKRGSGEGPESDSEADSESEQASLLATMVAPGFSRRHAPHCPSEIELRPNGQHLSEPHETRRQTVLGCCADFYYCLQGSARYRRRRRQMARHKGRTNSVSAVDRVSRIMFPLVFSIFNVFYWVIYASDAPSLLRQIAEKWK